MKKSLLVYNTCGIKNENPDWYIECINSFLKQDFSDYRVVLSSCLNSVSCIKKIYETFENKISYCLYAEPHTVNITFNKTIQESVKNFGEFESYIYVDSGCTFDEQRGVLSKMYNSMKSGQNGIVSLQVDTDEALQVLDSKFKYETNDIQIRDNDYEIPLGKAINQHVSLFSNKMVKQFGYKAQADVFAAYCSESVLNYMVRASGQKWIIMKDLQVRHIKSVDGASVSQPHWSPKFRNPWNNLLYGRDARDFVNNIEVQKSGLGYEECNNILMHNPDMYDKNGYHIDPNSLTKIINTYLMLNKHELDYNKIRHKFIA